MTWHNTRSLDPRFRRMALFGLLHYGGVGAQTTVLMAEG